MSDFKNDLIRLGGTTPELRKHLKPILAHLERQAGKLPFHTDEASQKSVREVGKELCKLIDDEIGVECEMSDFSVSMTRGVKIVEEDDDFVVHILFSPDWSGLQVSARGGRSLGFRVRDRKMTIDMDYSDLEKPKLDGDKSRIAKQIFQMVDRLTDDIGNIRDRRRRDFR